MNQFELIYNPLVQAWTTVLLHFVWQGTAIAIAVRLVLELLPERQVHARYQAGIVGLLAMIFVPAVTFWSIDRSATPVLPAQMASVDFAPIAADIAFASIPMEIPDSSALIEQPQPAEVPWSFYVPHCRVALFAFWGLAQAVLGARLIFGAVVVWRIRRTAERVTGEMQATVSRLAKRMGMRTAPALLRSSKLTDAATIGFLRMSIVVPAAWIGQMTPEMLEAVLAHELSHVRRYDVWVNLIQRIVETVFFYHPGVWWLSQQIRLEREYCCDADAVAVTDDDKAYAKTLEEAARYGAGQQFALVSNLGGKRMTLLKRINRVLGRRTESSSGGQWSVGVVALLVPVLIALTMVRSESFAVDPPEYLGLTITEGSDDATLSSPNTTTSGNAQTGTGKLQGLALAAPPESNGELSVDPQPQKQTGGDETATFTFQFAKTVPSEGAKISLPDYIIEPPDILLIEGIRLVERGPVELGTGDVLQVVVLGVPPDRPIAGQFVIEAPGSVNLGPGYGSVKVGGLTTKEASEVIRKRLLEEVQSVEVAVTIHQRQGRQFVTGEHLVGPDGTVNLGIYGRVYLAGMTIEGAKAAVEKRLSRFYESPVVSLDVFVSNSKFFYVITEQDDETSGDMVVRMPVTGNETVLDAIAAVGGMASISQKNIWVSRPSEDGDKILSVDWSGITRGGSTQTNYQLFPGDRLFISSRPPKGQTPEKIENAADEFNRLVTEGRLQEAIELSQATLKKFPKSAIALTISQHAQLLEANRIDRIESDTAKASAMIEQIRETRSNEARMRKALGKMVSAEFQNVPLKSVIQRLANQLDIDIVLDASGLASEGVTEDTPVTLNLRKQISARNMLLLILEPMQLKSDVYAGVLRITGKSTAAPVYMMTYPVGDLRGLPVNDPNGKGTLDYDELIELVESTIAPETWQKSGGKGGINRYEKNGSLVVSNTGDVHQQIAELFSQLRSAARKYPRSIRKPERVLPSPYYEFDEPRAAPQPAPDVIQRFPVNF